MAGGRQVGVLGVLDSGPSTSGPASWGTDAGAEAPVAAGEWGSAATAAGTSWSKAVEGSVGDSGSFSSGPALTRSEPLAAEVGVVQAVPATAPLMWLIAAGACALASVVMFFVTKGATMGVVGWLLAGPVAIGLWAAFIVGDNARRQTGWYRPSDLAELLRRGVVGVALVGVALNAFHIANDVARGVSI